MRILHIALLTAGLASVGTASTLIVRAESARDVVADMHAERAGPDSSRVAALLNTLDTVDPIYCELVSDQIGNYWGFGGSLRIGALSDASPAVRAAKDSLAERVRDTGAIRLLSATLAHDDACVRLVAAKMLGESGAPDDVITARFDDPSARVREAALRAAAAREREPMRARIEALLDARESAVVAMAAFALGEIESRASVNPLTRLLTHAAADVRANAVWALGSIEDPASEAPIIRRINDDTDRGVRLAAILALSRLDHPAEAPPVLVRLARGDDAQLREAALDVLLDIEDPTLTPLFIELVSHHSEEIRMRAVLALGELGSAEAVPVLTRALRDPSADVRRAAVEALAEIEDP
ncbi:MAG: HEAT repeat domain-containing protein [Gemmatimonadaceae bacterium]